MSGFSEREKGFEQKMAVEADQRFRAQAMRNKLLAKWVGARTGMTDEQVAKYAGELAAHDLSQPGDKDVEEKLVADLRARGVTVTAADVRAEMSRCLAQATATPPKAG